MKLTVLSHFVDNANGGNRVGIERFRQKHIFWDAIELGLLRAGRTLRCPDTPSGRQADHQLLWLC